MTYNLNSKNFHSKSSTSVVQRLLTNHVKPYKKLLFLSVFCMTSTAILSTAIVALLKPAINEIFITHDRKMLVLLPLVTIILFCIKGLAEYWQNYLIKMVGQNILRDIQLMMYEHLIFADLAFLQKLSSGKIISRFTNDISTMRNAVSSSIIGIARHLITVILLVIGMFILEPFLSLIVFLVFPAAIFPVQKLGKKMRRLAFENQEHASNYVLRLDETFQSIKVVKGYRAEKTEIEESKKITSHILELFLKVSKIDCLTSPIMEILSGIAMSIIMWYGGHLVVNNNTTPGSIVAFMAAFASAYRPFKSLLSLNVSLQEGLSATKRVFSILDTQPTIYDKDNAITFEAVLPTINFSNITLSLNNKLIIKDINLVIEGGKTTALIGSSGSGKTSIANLIMRFYDPDEGVLKIDNCDLKAITLESLRKHITLVTQETLLFDNSIFENIRYGSPEYSLEQVIKAAKMACAHEFISQLPNNYDAVIGYQGYTLSGGQRQRISIARAILRNTPILILDEATSSIDSGLEAKIYKEVMNHRRNKTNIIITHRISTIRDADKIVVLKQGKIIEQGTHQELLALKREYYKLYDQEVISNLSGEK